MQRAAAASTSTPTTPTGQKSAPESESPAPSPKRQRISNNNASSSDLRAISAAIRAEEEKRAAAIAKQAADAGETEWVLEFPAGTVKPAPKVVPDVEDEYEELEYGGRRSYGNYKKKTKAVVGLYLLSTSKLIANHTQILITTLRRTLLPTNSKMNPAMMEKAIQTC